MTRPPPSPPGRRPAPERRHAQLRDTVVGAGQSGPHRPEDTGSRAGARSFAPSPQPSPPTRLGERESTRSARFLIARHRAAWPFSVEHGAVPRHPSSARTEGCPVACPLHARSVALYGPLPRPRRGRGLGEGGMTSKGEGPPPRRAARAFAPLRLPSEGGGQTNPVRHEGGRREAAGGCRQWPRGPREVRGAIPLVALRARSLRSAFPRNENDKVATVAGRPATAGAVGCGL